MGDHLMALWQWVVQDPVKSITVVIATCSALHTVLPPWDWKPEFVTVGLCDFPSCQKAFYGIFNNRWYKLLVYTVGYVALNGRSTVWHYISVKNAEGPNANAKTLNGG